MLAKFAAIVLFVASPGGATVPPGAERAEAVREEGSRAFLEAVQKAGGHRALREGRPSSSQDPEGELDPMAGLEVVEHLRKLSSLPQALPEKPSLRGATLYLRLAPVKNAAWKSATQFPLGSRPAWVSLIISRTQDAFGSVLGEKDALPQFVNVRKLVDQKVRLTVNGKAYDAWLSPNIFDKLASKVNLKGVSAGDRYSVTLRDLIGSTLSTGFSAPVGDQTYSVFYYDEVIEQGGARLDPSRQTLAFAIPDGKEYQIYLIPAEQVPGDKPAVYKLFKDRRVGLQLLEGGAVLAITPEP